jgi:hypothetical protein
VLASQIQQTVAGNESGFTVSPLPELNGLLAIMRDAL